MRSISVTRETARRFLINAFGLNRTLPDVDSAVRALGFVQEDSIDVCGRIHDLILRNRVNNYAPSMLHDALYGPSATAFETNHPNLCALPRTDFRVFAPRMHARKLAPGRWAGLLPDEIPVADALLRRIDDNGPVLVRAGAGSKSDEFGEFGHADSGWGVRTRLSTLVAEKMWRYGALAIAGRESFARKFDRMERVFPDAHEILRSEPEDTGEFARERLRIRLRSKRLFRIGPKDRAVIGNDALVSVTFADAPQIRPYLALADDLDALADSPAIAPDACFFLAPLDPLVYDRQRTRDLFNFDYVWEVYTPEAKRKWGYYSLPIAVGERLVGRIEPRRNRKESSVEIRSFTLEPGVDPDEVAGPIEREIQRLTAFLS